MRPLDTLEQQLFSIITGTSYNDFQHEDRKAKETAIRAAQVAKDLARRAMSHGERTALKAESLGWTDEEMDIERKSFLTSEGITE